MHELEMDKESLAQTAAFLSKLDFFKGLPLSFLNELASSMKLVSFGGGEILIKQNEIGDCLYILLQGQLKIIIEKEGESTPVGQISPGQIVGEIALLVNQPRHANVKAIRDSLTLKLDKKIFYDLLEKHPQSIMKITQMCVNRLLNKEHPTKTSKIITLAILPAGDEYFHYKEFAERLANELSRTSKVLALSSKHCNQLFGQEIAQTPIHGAENASLTSWLNQQEILYEMIIYIADAELTHWTQRCLRQADRILLVAKADCNPKLRSIETELFNRPSGDLPFTELILLQNDLNSIHGTSKWFPNRTLSRHHHVRLNVQEDLARIARFVKGQVRSLVLSGGASKGPIYFGIFKALKELNIDIDMVGGTSVGGVFGSVFASRLPEEELQRRIHNLYTYYKLDYTFPLISFLKGKNWTKRVQDLCGENKMIEDLPINFFCVSANLTKNKAYIHDRGLLWKAVRASSSLPAIFPPVSYEGDMLVDGGIVNNIPVDIMRERANGGKILAIECKTEDEKEIFYPIKEPWVSGWQYLFKGLFKTKNEELRAPSVFKIINYTIAVGQANHRELMRKEADYYLLMKTPPLGMLEKKNFYKLIDIGYTDSIEYLSKLIKNNDY